MIGESSAPFGRTINDKLTSPQRQRRQCCDRSDSFFFVLAQENFSFRAGFDPSHLSAAGLSRIGAGARAADWRRCVAGYTFLCGTANCIRLAPPPSVRLRIDPLDFFFSPKPSDAISRKIVQTRRQLRQSHRSFSSGGGGKRRAIICHRQRSSPKLILLFRRSGQTVVRCRKPSPWQRPPPPLPDQSLSSAIPGSFIDHHPAVDRDAYANEI